jgi:RNA polymerase sigma factor, sigma-70 family
MITFLEDKNKDRLFDEISNKYYMSIFKYSYLKLNFNKEDAEDCTQETFTTLFNNLSKVRPDCIESWLYKTANNFINRQIRCYCKEKKHLTYPDESEKEEIENLAVYEENYDLLFENKVDIKEYMKLIFEQLTEQELTLWRLYFKESKSIKDICSILKISQTSATTRIYRLKIKIKCKMDNLLKEKENEVYYTKHYLDYCK